jgi:uncharacterized protein
MEIKHQDNGAKGAFYIEENNKRMAEMTYVWSGNKLIIDHTDVDASLKGMNIGKQLFDKVIALARAKQVKILPLCPFAKSIFNKNSEYHDVLF